MKIYLSVISLITLQYIGHETEKNLLDMYRSFYKSQDINFVNRIDKETAGLVIAAKKY